MSDGEGEIRKAEAGKTDPWCRAARYTEAHESTIAETTTTSMPR